MAVQNSSKYLNFPRTLLRASESTNPFKLYDASAFSGIPPVPTFKVGFSPGGKVNGVIPTIGGVPLWSETDPDYVQPTITVTATRHFFLKVVATFGSPDTYTVTIESNNSISPPAGSALTASGFTGYTYIGSAAISGSPSVMTLNSVATAGWTNVECDTDGAAIYFWIADPASPSL